MKEFNTTPLVRFLTVTILACTMIASTLGGVVEVGASAISSASQMSYHNQALASETTKVYNDTDPAWTYKGKWFTDKMRRTLKGQVHTSRKIGNYATISIQGSRFTLVYSQSPTEGKLDVYVDDKLEKTITQTKSKAAFQKEWTSPELGAGTHVVKFVHSSGKSVNVDAIKVYESNPGPNAQPADVSAVVGTPTSIPTEVVNLAQAENPTLTAVPTLVENPTSIPTDTAIPTLLPPSSPTAADAPLPTSVASITPVVVLPSPSPTATAIDTRIPPAPAAAVSTSGKIWYVDNLATGNNTGTSWKNAWKSFASVNFKAMGSGSILYISGGATSKTYTGTLTVPAGTIGITITKGIDTGHKGEVIFDGKNATKYGVNIYAKGTAVKNLIISNLTFKNYAVAGVFGTGQDSGGLQGITVDNCKFLNFNRAGVLFQGNNNIKNNYKLVVKNSYFDDNNAGKSQSDGIYVQVLKDFTADHNYIILDNNYTGVANLHSDNIQSFWVDNVTYSNNVVVQKTRKVVGTQMLFTENGYGMHVFLNNVFIRDSPNATDGAMRLKKGSGSTFKAQIIGNTYYGRGTAVSSSTATVIKNNIFYGISQPTSSRQIYATASGSAVSNNLFYDPNNRFPSAKGGTEVNPLFVSTNFSSINLHLRPGSPAINKGANLGTLGTQYTVDIEGKSRGSTWDIGAYENK